MFIKNKQYFYYKEISFLNILICHMLFSDLKYDGKQNNLKRHIEIDIWSRLVIQPGPKSVLRAQQIGAAKIDLWYRLVLPTETKGLFLCVFSNYFSFDEPGPTLRLHGEQFLDVVRLPKNAPPPAIATASFMRTARRCPCRRSPPLLPPPTSVDRPRDRMTPPTFADSCDAINAATTAGKRSAPPPAGRWPHHFLIFLIS
jgi:hypothetical protein